MWSLIGLPSGLKTPIAWVSLWVSLWWHDGDGNSEAGDALHQLRSVAFQVLPSLHRDLSTRVRPC